MPSDPVPQPQQTQPQRTPPPEQLPPEVRFLKLLTTVLAGVMIFGLLTIIGLLVTRLPGATKLPQLPAQITLPEGAKAETVTFGKTFTVVVTQEGRVLLYTAEGALAQDVPLN